MVIHLLLVLVLLGWSLQSLTACLGLMLPESLTHTSGGKVGGLCFVLSLILQEARLGSSHGDLRKCYFQKLQERASPNVYTLFKHLPCHVCEYSDGQSSSPG